MSTATPPVAEPADVSRGILLIMLSGLCLVGLDTLSKHLVVTYPVVEVVWARYIFHILVMLTLLGPRMGSRLVRTRRLGLQLARAGLMIVATITFFTGLRYLPLADASAIAFVSPLLLTVLAIPLLKEQVGTRRWAAVAVGFCGMLVILRPGAGVMHWAVVYPLVTAVLYALYQIFTRMLSHTEDPYATLFYTALAGAVVSTAAVPFYWVTPDLTAWILLSGTGLLGGLGHFALIKAFELAPASALAPLTYTQLVWATLAGYLVFGDFPDRWTITGALIIVGAGVFIFYRERALARAAA